MSKNIGLGLLISIVCLTGCQTLFEERGVSKSDESALFDAIEKDDTEFIVAFLRENGEFPEKVRYLLKPKLTAVATAARYRNIRLLGEYWELGLSDATKTQALVAALPLKGMSTYVLDTKKATEFGSCEEHQKVVQWLYEHGAHLKGPQDKNTDVDLKRGKVLRDNTAKLCFPILKTIVDHEPLAAQVYLNAWNFKLQEMIERDEKKRTSHRDTFWSVDAYQEMKQKLDYFSEIADGTKPKARYQYLMSKLGPIYARVTKTNSELAAKQKKRNQHLYKTAEGWTERGCGIYLEAQAYQNSINYLKEKSRRSGVLMGSDAESLDTYTAAMMDSENRFAAFNKEFNKKWGKDISTEDCRKLAH